MALLYGFLFPLIFLAAFWVLYRHEKMPLLRHLGELLTVSVLGGACFGLPTTLVSERERGVWRRYRMTPVPTWALVTSTVIARYILVLCAGALQLGVAVAVGTPAPQHPFVLWIAFTFVAFAFIGLGLVIAALADNVPAVQALGQCIFLPMLIIGGVAVQLTSLPVWAQRLATYFPGRHAVDALQACVTGGGWSAARFGVLALALIGVAGCYAGAKLFRWDTQERFAARPGKLWIVPALAAWLAVGLVAEWRGRMEVAANAKDESARPLVPPAPWMTITSKDVASLDYRVPPDGGVVAPFAGEDDPPNDYVRDEVEAVRNALPTWKRGLEGDEVQRVRNLLCVAAVPDSIQLPIERYLPPVVLAHLINTYPKDKLVRILTWIALHPEDGAVIDNLNEFGIDGAAGDPGTVRERAYYYAIKFIGRLTGRL